MVDIEDVGEGEGEGPLDKQVVVCGKANELEQVQAGSQLVETMNHRVRK